MPSSEIHLLAIGTDKEKAAFWEEKANFHQWDYTLIGQDERYEWTSHSVKVAYYVDAIKALPTSVKYILICDSYDSFVNVKPEIVVGHFSQFSNTVHFGNDLKYYEFFKGIYPMFPNHYANKLHNRIILKEKEYYFQSGIVGGNRAAMLNLYECALKHMIKGAREQKVITETIKKEDTVRDSLQIIDKSLFGHFFTRLYMFNFRKISYDQGNKQFIIDGHKPFVIHCPGALRPSITKYFWNYFISEGNEKDWRIRPFIRSFRK